MVLAEAETYPGVERILMTITSFLHIRRMSHAIAQNHNHSQAVISREMQIICVYLLSEFYPWNDPRIYLICEGPVHPGSPLPRAVFVNDVGYLPDGTPMNKAGNAINHPEAWFKGR